MKKFMKNTLLIFVIIYTILNLVLYVTSNILKSSLLYKEVVPLIEEKNIEKCIEIEEGIKEDIERYRFEDSSPATALFMFQCYFSGMNQVLYSQTIILLATVVLSISIGIIVSLTERSKVKELLNFLTVGVSCVLLCTTIMYITGKYNGFNIFEAIIETINSVGIYYIVAYIIKILYRYYKNKKSVKELNKEIEKKNK